MKRPLRAILWCSGIFLAAVLTTLATISQVPTGTWGPAAPMSMVRSGASAVLLQDGRVLIAGGSDANGPVASA